MKTEQLLLIIGAAFLLFRNRQTTLTLGNTNQRQNMQGGASGQPGNTGTMFGGGTAGPGQTAGQGTPGGGPATDRGSVWDRVTIGDIGDVGKGLGDFFGGLFK